jgi:uncharacterized protein YabE (DUF348 family)
LRRVFLATLLSLAILSAWFGGGLGLQREIAVAVDGERLAVQTVAATVGEALAAARVNLGPRDRLSPAPTVRVSDGMLVEVRRAVAVAFFVDGRWVRLTSAAATVGELLAGSRLPVFPDDRLEPGRDQAVVAGMRVRVIRVIRSYQHRDDLVAFGTVRREDMTMDLGRTEVIEEGRSGRMTRLMMVTYEDGREVSSRELSRTVLKEPVERVLRVGTAGEIVRGGQTIRFLKAVTMTATAYEPSPVSCGAGATGYTYVGLKATRGIIAVDPRVIPLWTKVYVDGYGFAVAGDTGSAIKGNRIDVCFDTVEEALHWGVKKVKLYILQLPRT